MRPSECVCAARRPKVLPNTLQLKERAKNSDSMYEDAPEQSNERHCFPQKADFPA